MDLGRLLDDPKLIEQLARSVGTGDREARSGLEALLPALGRGLERNAGSTSGLESLVKALGAGGHDRYLDAPDLLGQPATRDDGNAILGHIFGSKDVSRNVAGAAAQDTGLGADLLKKMLPIAASLAMGALSRSTSQGETLRQGDRPAGGLGDLLGPLLGGLSGGGAARSGDSPLDDVLDLAKKFL